MTGAINNLAASLSGAPATAANAQSQKVRQESTKSANRRGIRDSYVRAVSETEAIDAVRNLADADQEDAREDRQEHQIGYTRKGQKNSPRNRGLDLNA